MFVLVRLVKHILSLSPCRIDTPGVINRVSKLFHGRPELIQGFNTFLPQGYWIQCSPDSDYITVTSPSGNTRTIPYDGGQHSASAAQALAGPSISSRQPSAAPPAAATTAIVAPTGPVASTSTRPPVPSQQDRTTAVEYVYKIKQRCDPETYREFRDLLQQIQNDQLDPNNDELTRKIWKLFSHDPDLRADFKVFVPDREWPPTGVEPDDEEAIARHKRKRREREREKEREAAKVRMKGEPGRV